MSRTGNNLGGLKYVLAGLALMAVAQAASSAVMQFISIGTVLWADLAVHILAWAAVIFGMLRLGGVRVEFRRGLIVSGAGLVFTLIQAFFVFKQYRVGLGSDAFIDMYAMFGEYLADLCMLAVYYLSVKAMAQLLVKDGEIKKGQRWHRVLRWGIITVVVSMMLIPMASVFPTVIAVIIALAAIAAGLFMEFIMIRYINEAYRKIS